VTTQQLDRRVAESAGASEWPRLLALPFPVRTVARRWRGMIGMVLGVGVALGLVLTMMGLLGASMSQLVGDFQQSGANAFISVSGGTLIPFNRGDTPGTIEQGAAVLSKLRSIPGVQAAIGELSWSLQREHEGLAGRNQPAQFLAVMAVDGDPTVIPNFLVLREGRWLRRGNEIVLGPSLSGTMALGVGDSLKLNGLEYEVVGIGKLRGFGQAPDSVAYVDAVALRQRGLTGNILSYVAVQTTAPQAVRNVADDLSLSAITADELAQQTMASPGYQSAIVVYWLIDLFILFVAGMFVSNMLGRSVAERRTEFATLRAIGLSSRTILFSVAAEGLLVVLASFVVGFGVSLLLGEATNRWLAPIAHFDHLFSVDAGTDFTLFLLTLGLGIIASLAPARGATKVDPLEVLREV
jgi:ABC-type antimicrobial peptide transport system permease subunit